MKKVIRLAAILFLALTLSACGSQASPDNQPTISEIPPEPSPSPIVEPEPEATPEPVEVSGPGSSVMADSMTINIVKNGALELFPSQMLGYALTEVIADLAWETFEDGDKNFVVAKGTALYNERLASVYIQYLVDIPSEAFEIHAFKINDEEQGYDTYASLIFAAFEDNIISIVRDGEIRGYSGNFGAALYTIYDYIEWEGFLSTDGNVYVNADCYYQYEGTVYNEFIQFMVDLYDETFDFGGYWIDDEEADFDDFMELVELAYE